MLMWLCEVQTAEVTAENVGAFIQKSALQNFRNGILKTAKSERQFLLNFVLFEELIKLIFVEHDLLIRQVEVVADERITEMQTASFPEEEFQSFNLAHFSRPLSLKILHKVSLVDEYFPVPACTCSYGLDLALFHKLTDSVFGKSADECGALLDREHLHLVGGRCFCGLRNGVLPVLGELDQQLQNVVYDCFLFCCIHSNKPLSFSVLCFWSYELSAFSAQSKSENVDNVDCSDMGIDKNHNPTLVVAVRSLNSLTAKIAVFLQHIHCLGEVSGILEKYASAQLVQIILPDARDVLGAYLVQHTFSLDRAEVNVT